MRKEGRQANRQIIEVLKDILKKPTIAGAAAGGSGAGAGGLSKLIPGGIPAGVGGGIKALAKRIPGLAALLGVAGIADALTDEVAPGETVGGKVGKASGGLAGGLAGASAGAALGSIAGPPGALVGGLAGGAIGALGGEKIGEKVGEAIEKAGIPERVADVAGRARDTVARGAAAVADGAGRLPSPIRDAASGAADVARQAARMAPQPVQNVIRSGLDSVKDLTVRGRWLAVKDSIVQAAGAAGVDPGTLAQIARFESKFDTNAAPIGVDTEKSKRARLNTVRQHDGRMAMSSAHGLGQFTDATWTDSINRYGTKYGIADAGKLTKEQAAKYRSDPKIQAAMLAEFTAKNVALGRSIGGDDDAANVYALHNLGEGDGRRLLQAVRSNPNVSVREALIGGRSITPKEQARIESVIAGNDTLYGNGSGPAMAAYRKMGSVMRDGDVYADDARKAAKVAAPASPSIAKSPQAGSVPQTPSTSSAPGMAGAPAVGVPGATGAPGASGATGAPGTAVASGAATLPQLPGVAVARPPVIAPPSRSVASFGAASAPPRIGEAPKVEVPEVKLIDSRQTAPSARPIITQDIPDRNLAHIASGGLGMATR